MQVHGQGTHHYHYHYRPTYTDSRKRYYLPKNTCKISRSNTSSSSCNSARTSAGLLGDGLAASVSKKDSYPWALPLSAVIDLGVVSNCYKSNYLPLSGILP